MASLRSFANDAGVRVVLCGPGWGGRYGYVESDHPNCVMAGYKTKREAREAWAKDTFGESNARALFNLLGHQEKPE